MLPLSLSVDLLWKKLSKQGSSPSPSAPQYKWRDLISNFSLNFKPPVAAGETAESASEEISAESSSEPEPSSLSYEEFLTLEGAKTAKNPYKEQIMETPVHLPDEEELQQPCVAVEGYVLVETWEGLDAVIKAILSGKHRAVALDVEHHCTHSYRGFTCLIQLGTCEANYLIDPLGMFHQMGALNNITANPNILKIFHHASLDVAWLQRDFGIYVVNAFDTGLAAKVLGFPEGNALSKVLQALRGIEKNEKITMEDWRQRPLPAHMLEYASQDIRHLFFLYRHFGGELAELQKTEEGKAVVQLYGDHLKKIFSKGYNYTPYRLEEEAFILGKEAPAGLHDLLMVVLAWRDIRARFLDVGRHVLIPKRQVVYVALKLQPVNPRASSLCAKVHRKMGEELVQELCHLVTAWRKERRGAEARGGSRQGSIRR